MTRIGDQYGFTREFLEGATGVSVTYTSTETWMPVEFTFNHEVWRVTQVITDADRMAQPDVSPFEVLARRIL